VEEYKKECYDRKPNPGMIEEAIREFGIDCGSSFVVGDKISDIEAGKRAGCRTALIENNKHPNEGEGNIVPDCVASDLTEAVGWLLKLSAQEERLS